MKIYTSEKNIKKKEDHCDSKKAEARQPTTATAAAFSLPFFYSFLSIVQIVEKEVAVNSNFGIMIMR